MCKTRWVERHEAYEVLFAIFSCIMRALEVMAHERLFAGQYGDAAWRWDTDTKNKVSRLANAISSFSGFYNQLVDGNEMPFRPETR